MSMTTNSKQLQLDNTLRTIARMAAAEVVSTAASAASQVALTASQAATQVAAVASATAVDISYIKDELAAIKARLENRYVSIEAFDPVRRLVYGLVGVVLMSVVGAVLALLIKAA